VTRYLRSSPRLPVKALRDTILFYVETLGFSVDVWPDDDPTFAIFTREGASIHFSIWDESRKPMGDATIYFDVDDVRAVFEQVKDKAEVEWGPEVYWYGRREFSIKDPNGYSLIFSEIVEEDSGEASSGER
jgi:uncharacterized glyoxalase superfamily protein PhnB